MKQISPHYEERIGPGRCPSSVPHPPMPPRHRFSAIALLSLLAVGFSGCAAPLNFTNPAGPLYQGCETPQVAATVTDDELRIVTFNIKYSREIDRAIELLNSEPALQTAEIVLLQEMDEPGVERIGRALGMCWVYYPATVHPGAAHNFGNAILSRLPLADPKKVILPHLGGFGRTQRIATSATVEFHGQPIRVYSLHVATQVELSAEQRRAQVEAVMADARATGAERVIIGGDLNDKQLCYAFEKDGYDWLTRHIGRTCKLWSLDHVFSRGLSVIGEPGKIEDNRGASDHRPVWVSMAMRSATQAAS